MTKSEVIKEFFKKSVLPVAVAALLYCIFKSACTKDGVTDYVWLFILCGLPFGIPRMFAWIVPSGSLGTALPLFLLNFIIGGVIGGFVLVWRLLVAAWYIPLTIYRLFITRGTSYIPEYPNQGTVVIPYNPLLAFDSGGNDLVKISVPSDQELHILLFQKQRMNQRLHTILRLTKLRDDPVSKKTNGKYVHGSIFAIFKPASPTK